MAVKIRLQRKGRKKAVYFYIVVADSRSPRDGKFIERIGTYNPIPKVAQIDINFDKAIDWMHKGAIPTKTVRSLLSVKGVLYKNHLLRGVKKGVITEEQADKNFADYLLNKSKEIELKLEKIKNTIDKESKLSLEREAKVNELRARKITDKRAKHLEKTKAKAEHARELEAEAAVETDVTTVTETPEETPVAEVSEETSVPEASEEAPAEVAE